MGHSSLMHLSRTQWLCASLSLFVFAGLALGEAGLWPLEAFDRAVTDAVPALRTETLNLLMLAVTALGNTRFLVFVAFTTVVALLAAKAWREAILFGIAFTLMPLIVKLLKMTIARPRPTVDLYGGVESFSFPSGHATNSALIYGALALLALAVFRKLPGRLIAAAFVLLAIMIAVSRIYLGAHWPSDTLAGLGLAGLMLTLMSVIQDELRLPDAARFVPLVLILITAAFPLYLMVALPEARDLYTALQSE
jgi:membrane-associated phospholipid phosphatase